jgi:hypothetical protein
MEKVVPLSHGKEIVSRSSEAELRGMVVAGMLGTALFLIEAGAIELILRADRLCQGIRATEWAFNPRGCQPEAVTWMLRGLSRGLLGALRPDLSPVAGVATMALAMGLIAALLSALPARRAVPAYFVVQIAAAAIFTALGYLLFFIA